MSEWTDFETTVKADTINLGPECTIRVMLRGLPEDGRAAVLAALAADSVQSSAIARALRARIGNTAPGVQSVRRHRRSDCSCGRKDNTS